MKGNKEIVAIVCAVFVSVVAAVMLTGDFKETPEAPVPEEMPTYFDDLVKVTAHNPGGSRIGSGIVVQHDDVVFVLTSKMIFTEGDTSFDVLLNGVTYSAGVVLKDKARGLVALDIPVNFGGYEIDDAPNLPPDATASVCSLDGDTRVTVKRYLTDPDWMLLDGYIPGKSTGAPMITRDGHLAGIVIGVNTENAAEAFAVGNHAIREFVFAMALFNGISFDTPRKPPILEPIMEPHNPNDMGNVPRKPTN